ncbi:cell division protein FtsQ/DivIB [Desulfofustis glycolicus]|uniref:Cell division protein FtsQ n=1 Tax=Desulfofustis glycolicus DSM 9705 TaxID=1121409 RepID=A0A1M5XX27_9BACT|nr:FtsQ-type POTRA domain-containing protein [Desulfofustis glycolicus]MCB2215493.1 FtsQ-type POTRA domain-containing protein [Desulfobulbaceae bacterium]SHI04249.1 cell division protein FtsQ [Desulfofustis glycolicus DSM 9705]
MKASLPTRIREMFRRWRARRRITTASPAAGQFVRLDSREQRLKKSLLKKLNSYWAQKKMVVRESYGSERRGGVKWRSSLLVVCLVLAAVVFVTGKGPGGLLGLLESIDYFRLAAIDVRGCHAASEQRVRSAAGVSVNTSLITIDTERIASAVVAADRWIKDVTIARHWPDRLVIKVREYRPYALITMADQDGNRLAYLDRDGTPFLQTDAGMDLDYPAVTGLEQEVDDERRRESLREPLSFLHLVGANNPNLPAQSVSELHVDEEEGLVVYLVEHPFPIFFGSGEIRQKYIRLRQVLEVLYKPRKSGMDIARVAYIRMNYLQDKVIVGYRES